MRKKVRFCLTFAVMISTMLLSASCGAKKESLPDGETGPLLGQDNEGERTYLAETYSLDNVAKLNAICGLDTGFYYSTGPETGGSDDVFFFDAFTQETERVSMDLPKEENAAVTIPQMAVLNDGSLVLLQETRFMTDPASSEEEPLFFLRIISPEDGQLLAETDITADLTESGETALIGFMATDREDLIYLSDGSRIWGFDKTATKQFVMEPFGRTLLQSMGTSKEGQVICLNQEQSAQAPVLNVISPASQTISRTCRSQVPYTGEQNIWEKRLMTSGIDGGILLESSQGLDTYDLETETASSLLEWADCGIYGDSVRFISTLKNEKILVLSSPSDGSFEASILSRADAAELPEKEVITMGVMYLPPDISRAITDFNNDNDSCQIQLVNYRSGDWQDGMTQFNMDLAAGKGPDIIDLCNVDMKLLAGKGILEDLTPYLEQDPELNREDYFSSVLNAFSMDEKLYGIPNRFSVHTVFAKTSEVGETPGWTLDEMMALMESKPAGTKVFDYGTKDYQLQELLRFSADSFVNWESGECRFESEDFVRLLEFANSFDSELPALSGEDSSTLDRLQNGTLLTYPTALESVMEYQKYEIVFQEPVTMIGFPVPEGCGNIISGHCAYAINSRSEHKEAAWEFIKSLISPAYYERLDTEGFPSLISAYDKVNAEYMTPDFCQDENGNQTEQIKISEYFETVPIDLYAVTQEEVDAVTSMIENCDRAYFYYLPLMNIVSEEAAAYFDGQKTAQETAAIIQNRVQIYVDENL